MFPASGTSPRTALGEAPPAAPCQGGDVWVALSGATKEEVREAAMACATCPLLEWCERDLIRRISAEHDLADQLQAGRFFKDTGRLVSGRQFMGVHKQFDELMSQRPVIVQSRRSPRRHDERERDVA